MPFFRPASRALSHLLRHDPSCHLSSPASLFSRHSPLAPFSRAFDHPFFSSPLYTIYEVRDGDKDSSHTKAEQHKPEEAKAAEPQQPQQQQSTDSRLTNRHEDSHRQRWLDHRSDRRHRHRHHSHHRQNPLSLFSPFDSLLASSPFFQQAALQPLEIKVDLYSTPTAYQVNAAIPGVRKQDIKLTVEDGVLTIEAERREERGRTSQPTANAAAATANTSSSGPSSSSAAAPQAEQKSGEVGAKADSVDAKPVAETKAQETQQQQQQHEVDEDEDEDIAVHHVESHYGRVQRSLALPEDVNVDGLTARYEDGVLRIELPRVEERKQQVKQISIN